MLVGEHGGDPMMPRIATMKRLRRHEPKAAPEARQSLQDCSIDLTMTKIASMTPPVPRGNIIGERVGAQPVDELGSGLIDRAKR